VNLFLWIRYHVGCSTLEPKLYEMSLVALCRMIECYFSLYYAGLYGIIFRHSPRVYIAYNAYNVKVHDSNIKRNVARQQLCKHGSTRNNTGGCVFYDVCAEQRWNNGFMQPVSKQWLEIHTSA
jgi:hypothetical protein